MKAYKAFDKDLKCKGFQYKVGKTYTFDGEPIMCHSGYHACKHLVDVFLFYPTSASRVCEVEILGDIEEGDGNSKIVTNKIRIVRELDISELNLGKENKGKMNTGRENKGNWNTGNKNVGDCNTGYRNNGNNNAGNTNIGSKNTGSNNDGDGNTGTRNFGSYNTSSGNFGNSNTGRNNYGHENTGNNNWGDKNTGCWNVGDCHTGYFNTDKVKKYYAFNKEVDINDWKYAYKPPFLNIELTSVTPATGAKNRDRMFLHQYQDAFRISWDAYKLADNLRVRDLPNFDADLFLEITGIDVREEAKKIEHKPDEIAAALYLYEKWRKIKEHLPDTLILMSNLTFDYYIFETVAVHAAEYDPGHGLYEDYVLEDYDIETLQLKESAFEAFLANANKDLVQVSISMTPRDEIRDAIPDLIKLHELTNEGD